MKKDNYVEECTVSIIMGIYNCEATLAQAIESILNQTYTNWELILCDDGSKDQTYSVANHYVQRYPEKIFLLRNDVNCGLNETLNRCLKVAKGKYIARMDGDDVCDPSRLEKEVAVLENEKDIAIVSSDMEFFDENGCWGKIAHPTYPQAKDFLYGSPFCHAPCLVRKEAYDAVKGYTVAKRFLRVEDYHLWLKMYVLGYKGKNIHEPLYKMRDDRNAYSRRKLKYRLNEAYVKILVVKMLRLPWYGYIYAIRPIVVGLLPKFVYDYLHRRSLRNA